MELPSNLSRGEDGRISIQPEEFRCAACGGLLAAETVGMYSGKRWVHTCGESIRDRLGEPHRNLTVHEPSRSMSVLPGATDVLKLAWPLRRAALEALADQIEQDRLVLQSIKDARSAAQNVQLPLFTNRNGDWPGEQ